jgi:hypothetical protein
MLSLFRKTPRNDDPPRAARPPSAASTPTCSTSHSSPGGVHATLSTGSSPLRNVSIDQAEEAAIRARAAKQVEKRASSAASLTILLVALTMLASLNIGLVFGWSALASVLEGAGVYSSLDPEARAVRLTLLYTLATSALAFGGIPAGVLIESQGPARAALVAGTMVTAGLLGLAALPASAGDLFAVPLMLLGAGGILTCFTGFRAAPLLPGHSQNVMISINTLFQMSSAVPSLFLSLCEFHHISRRVVFGAAAAYTASLYLAWALAWAIRGGSPGPGTPAATLEEQPERESAKAPAQGAASADAAPADAAPADAAPADAARAPPPAEAGITPLDPGCSLTAAFTTPQFVYGVLWFVSHQYRSNLYLGEGRYMLLSLGDNDGTYQELFSASLMGAVLCIPLISLASHVLGLAGTMQAVNVLSAAHVAAALVPALRFQLVTFALYVPYRSAIFSTASIYVASTFGFAKLGVVYGTFQSLGAIFSFTLPPLAGFVLSNLNGEWAAVLWACLGLSGLQVVLVHTLVQTAGRPGRAGRAEERLL